MSGLYEDVTRWVGSLLILLTIVLCLVVMWVGIWFAALALWWVAKTVFGLAVLSSLQ